MNWHWPMAPAQDPFMSSMSISPRSRIRIAEISSRLVVNRAALKTRATEVTGWIDRLKTDPQA